PSGLSPSVTAVACLELPEAQSSTHRQNRAVAEARCQGSGELEAFPRPGRPVPAQDSSFPDPQAARSASHSPALEPAADPSGWTGPRAALATTVPSRPGRGLASNLSTPAQYSAP